MSNYLVRKNQLFLQLSLFECETSIIQLHNRAPPFGDPQQNTELSLRGYQGDT